MAWNNNGSGSHIPRGIKAEVRERQGNMCATIDARVCTGHIHEFDHIVPVSQRRVSRHELDKLISADEIRGVCVQCHAIKTQREARAASRHARKKRAPYQHPGLI